MQDKTLRLVLYVVSAYLLIRLIPALEEALTALEHVAWQWVVVAFGLEILSEMGFVVAWRKIVDPADMLGGEGRGERVASRVAWAQLGGGMLLPGGSFSSAGVGIWLLHHFGMRTKQIAERQISLQFLNTAVDALALIAFGLGLAVGIFPGEHSLTLTLLPAALAAFGLALALRIAGRLARKRPERSRHPKIAAALVTLGTAVEDTKGLLVMREHAKSVAGAVAYLGLDVLVLWVAFRALHTHPVPGFAIVLMAYIIGALGGSLPLPAGIGAIGGMVGMLIVYHVHHDPALAAVLFYQAVGQIVPLAGGGVAYLFLRRDLGSMRAAALESSA